MELQQQEMLMTEGHRRAITTNIDFALSYYRHLKHVRDYVLRNLSEKFQLEDVAVEVGVSSSRLSHLFIEKTGVSFSDWIRGVRIGNAIDLLHSDDRPIADIALSVGYDNVRTFERAFKRTTGVTASKFRASLLAHKSSQK